MTLAILTALAAIPAYWWGWGWSAGLLAVALVILLLHNNKSGDDSPHGGG